MQEELKSAVAERKRVTAKAATQAAAAATEQSRLKAEVHRLTGAAAAAAEAGEKSPAPNMATVRGATALSLQSELAKARLRAGARPNALNPKIPQPLPLNYACCLRRTRFNLAVILKCREAREHSVLSRT